MAIEKATPTSTAIAGVQAPSMQMMTIEKTLSQDNVKKRIMEMMGDKAQGFISSIIQVTNGSAQLKACEPGTIIAAAVTAATLDLPINQNLGFAYIVPYGGKAQFQMGWRGFVQLAIRTGQYYTVHASEVYADELKSWNPITSLIEYTPQETWKMRDLGNEKNIVGYVAFFKLNNGFEKYYYMSVAQVDAHAKKYSQTYKSDKDYVRKSSKWTTDFSAMARKTVLKLLLGRFGILSIKMETALKADQAVVYQRPEGGVDFTYPDNADEVRGAGTVPTAVAIEGGVSISEITGEPIEM